MTKSSSARDEDRYSQIFEDIYKRQSAMVYRVCFSYMRNRADTEDVVTDVFSKLLKTGIVFKDFEHEKAWLLRTAINKCKDYLKHWWRRCADIDDYETLEIASSFQESELMETILALPERYKDVIYLYYYEGYSTSEVAQILGKPPSTIRSHMQEAREILREVLENER